ncbi:MAG: glucans biosynthesis glucosyltransferase MdoH, partial [Elstera sp.]
MTDLTARPDADTDTETTPAMGLRRGLMLVLCLGLGLAVTATMVRILGVNGWSWAEIGALTCFILSLPWTVLGFWNALIGFGLVHITGRLGFDPVAAVNPRLVPMSDRSPITTRTAITMTIRHEDPDAVIARLRLMRADLEASGWGRQFHFFLLSDTSRPDAAATEEAAFAAWKASDAHPEELIYRRRTENTGFKAGNVRDFLTRYGEGYDFFLPLDADSLMGADSILRLVRSLQTFPQVGLLQTLVVGMPSGSFFARAFQFGMRQGMRTYTMGGAWWQGDCGPFWGHNALIRLAPFRDECELPVLPGKPPLGGLILSHDQVEAALLRRAGYEVRVVPEEGASWEENPPALPDFVKRDLRWCQGNMQYFQLLGLPGLRLVSRIQILLAILMYVGAPAWMGFLLFGLAQAYLPAGPDPYPAKLGLSLFAVMMSLSLAPKVLGVIDLLLQRRERQRYGGTLRLVGGAMIELVLMTLFAPVISLIETRFMIGLLFGKAVGWDAQQRQGYRVSWGQAIRGLWFPTLFGSLFGIGLWIGAPGALPWAAPLLTAYLLAIPLCVVTASPSLGALCHRWGILAIPEELAPTAPVHLLPGAI